MRHLNEFDWLAIFNAILRYNTAYLTSEVNSFVGLNLLQCTRLSLIDFLTQNLHNINLLLLQLLPSSNFWDIYCCWGILSPLEILIQCRQLTTFDLTIWNTQFRPQLLHMESCRLVFLFKSPLIISKKKKIMATTSSFTIRIQQLLSEKCNNFLKQCNGTSFVTIIRPESLINGKTGDKIFDKIQNKFKIHGIIPSGSFGAYWICFLLIYSSNGQSALQIATMEIARNCLCLIEYNSWPLTYLASLIESLSNTIINISNQINLSSDEIYQKLKEYLNQIHV